VLIKEIQKAMLELKHKIRAEYKFYSPELINNLFKHPYTKIEFLENDLGVSRITAANYLNKLAQDGILKKEKLKTGNYYINEKLFKLLTKKV
jgi:predicted transcriptional regulator